MEGQIDGGDHLDFLPAPEAAERLAATGIATYRALHG
jgi:hypothetical protein